GRPGLFPLGPLGREGSLGSVPTMRTMLDLGTMLCDLHPHQRQLKYLPALVSTGGHVPQRGPTGPTTLDGMELAVVRLGHGVQRMALVAWLSALLCATAAAETARVGLLQAITARGLTALAAVFPPLVLS